MDLCASLPADTADSDYVFASSAEHKGIYEALETGDGERAALLLQQQKARGCEALAVHSPTTFSTRAL